MTATGPDTVGEFGPEWRGSWDDYRAGFDRMSDHVEEWQGLPIPLPDLPLRLHDRHPLADAYRSIDGVGMELLVGGPALDDGEDEELVNHWFSYRRNADVFIFHRKPSGRAFAFSVPRSPDSSMDRLTFWLNTIGAADAWDQQAERKARTKLRSLFLTDRQWRHYDLTGSFLETSPRSGITYVFRRLRPTIALTPRWPWFRTQHEQMRVLAVLCMHPIGYYEQSWGGCLVPSDDVIAHLLYMRADEAGFWKQANQHEPRQPEAGL